MSATEREMLAGSICRAYGKYVDSKAYWKDKRRQRRRMRDACLLCLQEDLKEFRGMVVSALEFMEMESLPSDALVDALDWLSQRMEFAKADFMDWQKHGMTKRECRRYGFAIEVAECLVEVVHL